MQAKVNDLLDPYEDNSNNFDEIKGKLDYIWLLTPRFKISSKLLFLKDALLI